MPTYDYKCHKCNRSIEGFHRMDEELKLICPVCNEKMVKCIGGGIGVHFKGTGFYATDYKCK